MSWIRIRVCCTSEGISGLGLSNVLDTPPPELGPYSEFEVEVGGRPGPCLLFGGDHYSDFEVEVGGRPGPCSLFGGDFEVYEFKL